MIEVKTIEIDINGVTLKLSPEQATELQQKLNGLLSSPTYAPYTPWPTYPYWQTSPSTCEPDTWTTTSTSDITLDLQ